MDKKMILPALIIFSAIAILCFLIKLISWLRLRSSSKVGFVTSFFIFFSIHDVHNASSRASKIFRKYNNILNALFWGSLFGLAIVFVFNTNNVNGLIPTKKENRQYKDKSAR